MKRKYDITIIDNFKIYNKIDRIGLWHEVGTRFLNNIQTISYYNNHIIIYYKILNINIKLYEIILFGDKNQLIDLINKNNLYNFLSDYIKTIKYDYKVYVGWRSVSVVHSNIYYYIRIFSDFINNFINKFKIKRKLNKSINFGDE